MLAIAFAGVAPLVIHCLSGQPDGVPGQYSNGNEERACGTSLVSVINP